MINGIAFNRFKIFVVENFGIISTFCFKFIWWKRLVNSVKIFHAGINSTKPIQKYPHIIQSYVCFYVFITYKCSNFFWNMLYSERIKISNIITLYVQSNPMSSNIRVLVKIYFITPLPLTPHPSFISVEQRSGKLSLE